MKYIFLVLMILFSSNLIQAQNPSTAIKKDSRIKTLSTIPMERVDSKPEEGVQGSRPGSSRMESEPRNGKPDPKALQAKKDAYTKAILEKNARLRNPEEKKHSSSLAKSEEIIEDEE